MNGDVGLPLLPLLVPLSSRGRGDWDRAPLPFPSNQTIASSSRRSEPRAYQPSGRSLFPVQTPVTLAPLSAFLSCPSPAASLPVLWSSCPLFRALSGRAWTCHFRFGITVVEKEPTIAVVLPNLDCSIVCLGHKNQHATIFCQRPSGDCSMHCIMMSPHVRGKSAAFVNPCSTTCDTATTSRASRRDRSCSAQLLMQKLPPLHGLQDFAKVHLAR